MSTTFDKVRKLFSRSTNGTSSSSSGRVSPSGSGSLIGFNGLEHGRKRRSSSTERVSPEFLFPLRSELLYHALLGNPSHLDELLSSKREECTINWRGPWLRTALHWAALCGHLETVEALLLRGADPGIGDDEKMTPLHLSAMNGHLEVTRALIRCRRTFNSVNAKDMYNQTALDLAKTQEITDLLAESGGQHSDEPKIVDGVMNVWDAAERGDLERLREIVQRYGTSNLNPTGAFGWTPLHYSSFSGQFEAAKILLQKGVQPNSTDDYGWTPLHWAVNNSHIESIMLLLAFGADKNKTSTVGEKPIDLAKKEEIKQLLQAKTDQISLFRWMRANDLLEYFSILAAEDITLRVLSSITEAELIQLGLKLGARKKIASALAETSKFELESALNSPHKSHSSAELAIEIRDIEINGPLGEGCFGAVYFGVWAGATPVALKCLKDKDHMKEFLAEAVMLQKLRHPEIVSYFGIFTSPEGVKYICTELLPLGSLEKLLRTVATISLEDELQMAMDAAVGMDYLAANRIVHRDLAARNILVREEGGRYRAKVADFGLSRSVENYYHSQIKQFSVRWTALEAMKFLKFSTKSDVWSYGVVLWEIWSGGQVPYYMFEKSQDIIDRLSEGYRLPKPDACPQPIYDIMLSCWKESPAERPSFKEIYERLKLFMREAIDRDDNHTPGTPVGLEGYIFESPNMKDHHLLNGIPHYIDNPSSTSTTMETF